MTNEPQVRGMDGDRSRGHRVEMCHESGAKEARRDLASYVFTLGVSSAVIGEPTRVKPANSDKWRYSAL